MLYGYIRTSTASVDPENQARQLRAAGVEEINIFRDLALSGRTGASSRLGWHTLDSHLKPGDTVVVASIDRIGRRWLDSVTGITNLWARGIRVRTLAENEKAWADYLDQDSDNPKAFVAVVLLQFAAFIASQEVENISRRTKAGLERARAAGKALGRPRALDGERLAAAMNMRAQGMSNVKIGRTLGVSEGVVRKWVGANKK